MASEPKGVMFVPVWVDSGVVKALVLDSGALPVTETTPLTSIQAQAYGHIDGAWQKQPIIISYSRPFADRAYNLNSVAGDNVLTIGNVPAGEVWVVTHLSAVDLDNDITGLIFATFIGGHEYRLGQVTALAASISFDIQGPIYLEYDDSLRAYLSGVTLNDDIHFWAIGYIMDVDL